MKHLIKRDLRPAHAPANEPGPAAVPAREEAPEIAHELTDEAGETARETAPDHTAQTMQPAPPAPAAPPAAGDDIEAIIAAAKAAASAAQPAQAAPRVCLVVDDSRMIRKVARRIVEGLGFVVVEAENGEEAIAACRKRMPDLVMTDWDMPVMTGLEFVGNFRALPGSGEAKVVFCTSKSSVHDIHAGIAAGADEYVVKPFDELGLRRKLENLGLT